MKKKITFGLALIALIGGAIFVFFPREKVLAEVGQVKITDREVRLAMKALRAVSTVEPTEAEMLERMIRGQQIAEIIRQRGPNTLEQAFSFEADRWENTKGMSEAFREAKKTVGDNREKIRKLVLLPMMNDHLAFTEGYLKDDDFHQEKREIAEAFLEKAIKSPKNLSEMARRENLEFTKGLWLKGGALLLEKTMRDFARGPVNSKERGSEQQGIENLEKLAPGQVLDHLVEKGSGWWIIKSLGPYDPIKNQMKIEAVYISRTPFVVWLQKNMKLVSVKKL